MTKTRKPGTPADLLLLFFRLSAKVKLTLNVAPHQFLIKRVILVSVSYTHLDVYKRQRLAELED